MESALSEKPGSRGSVVMLANGHPVFDTRIFVKEAITLTKAGYKVCIILPASESVVKDGVEIIALPDPLAGWKKLIVNPWRILRRAIRQPRTAVFQIHDSNILLVGVALRCLGRKVIYDAHEDTPLQISYQHWMSPFVRKIYAWFYFVLEKFCGWIFHYIIVAEPVIGKYFPAHKTALVRNFPIVDSFRSHTPVPYKSRKKNLTYIGTLTAVRGLFEMAKGAKLAKSTMDFEFVLGGKFSPASLEQKVLSEFPVTFLGWVSYNGLVDVLFNSRIGIIITHPIERYKTNYPVKLFEYMAAGLPVIVGKNTEAAGFVQEANCGIVVDPMNINEIAQAIIRLFSNEQESEDMGLRGQKLIFEKYNWEVDAETLLRVVNKVMTA
jgi:glycosyltransferase involved in cell wall biosynthesis